MNFRTASGRIVFGSERYRKKLNGGHNRRIRFSFHQVALALHRAQPLGDLYLGTEAGVDRKTADLTVRPSIPPAGSRTRISGKLGYLQAVEARGRLSENR